ncbi:hypothetical protein EVAR_60014_1 [Eumeta japonica]|uniref:Uncharacterized protein n=1 Tax=Eumeta variegata TaxID=151549 RepID=A0A4C1ZM89_EUMVA|nr:hypothetical protein EVAR_60014_1 [Eumeta japonica]
MPPYFGSDHLSVLLRLGSFTGEDYSSKFETVTDWQRVLTALKEVDTPNRNIILSDNVPKNDIDIAIRALTNHIGAVVGNCQRKYRTPIFFKFPAFDPIHATRIDEDDLPQLSSSIDEEVKRKATLPPKDDLPPVSSDKVHKHIRKLKTRKTLILD